MRGNHLFELFRAENAEKVIPPHLGSSLDPWSPVRGNHLFELFRAETAEKVIPPHLGSSLPHLVAFHVCVPLIFLLVDSGTGTRYYWPGLPRSYWPPLPRYYRDCSYFNGERSCGPRGGDRNVWMTRVWKSTLDGRTAGVFYRGEWDPAGKGRKAGPVMAAAWFERLLRAGTPRWCGTAL